MKHRLAVAVLFLAVTAMGSTPIAMRVEVEPVGSSGDRTNMAITVQVAPEDRSKIGTDAWIQGELRQRGERVERLARAVDLDESGQARIEASWPPGDYELQIEIEGAQRKGTGVWIHKITVPDMRNTTAQSDPNPVGTSMIAASAATAAAATAESDSRSTAPETRDEEPPAAPEPESPAPPSPEPTTETIAAGTAATTTVAAVGSEAGPSAPEPRDPQPVAPAVPESTALPSPEPTTETIAAGTAATTTVAAAESEPRSPIPEPRDPEPATPAEPQPAPEWRGAPGSTDLTVMVTERNRPVAGLGISAFSLKIAGNDVAIQRIGEGEAVPLNLGLAVGVSQTSRSVIDNVVRQLEKLALRTTSGSGEILFATTGADISTVLPWGVTPDEISKALESASNHEQTNLGKLLRDSVLAFEGRRGRSALIVVTDGGDNSTKADWKDASSAAASAGIPIFVIGLDDSGFPSRTRSNLIKLAATSGGRSYFLANVSILQMTLDYVGELIETSYVLQFTAQPGGGAVRVESGNRGWEVHHPSRIP